MRNDAMLNTGLSSAAQRKLEARQQQAKKDRDIRRGQLTPGAEIVLAWIEQEKQDVVNLEKIILNVSDEKFLQAQLLARQMHLEFLNSMKNRAKNMLRTVMEAEKQRDVDNPWAKAAHDGS